MTRIVKGSTILLLLVPLLLGAATSEKRAGSKGPAINQEVAKATSSVPTMPTSKAHLAAMAPTSTGGGPAAPMVSSPTSNYTIDWSSINSGGTTNTSSTNYTLGSSVGQPAAGPASSPNYQVGAGFWYGFSGCNCPYQGDINASGAINVQDVVLAINRVFKGAAAVKDPLCPKERADFNANGTVNVLDITGEINRVFRGGPLPVNPCGA